VSRGAHSVDPSELPAELDFFKYAKAGTPKRKAVSGQDDSAERKRSRKTEPPQPIGSQQETDDVQDAQSLTLKQRVTAKGKNVPDPVVSFQQLADRYQLSSLLLKNLDSSGYRVPTGVQAHGIPILLEARVHYSARESLVL
jgi:ATP-dependent RNA helicase DDX52/ROK1